MKCFSGISAGNLRGKPQKVLRVATVCGMEGCWGGGGAPALLPTLASNVPFEFRGGTVLHESLSSMITPVDEERSSQDAAGDFSASWFKFEAKRLWERDWGEQRRGHF